LAQAILPPILFLSVWPHGWMDQDATWCEGRPQPMPHCVRRDPSPKKGHSSPLYLVHVYCGQLEIPDCIYNWIKDVFKRHAHCTKYARLVSSVTTIYASIIQGSALGPTSYIVTAADLHQVYAGNRIFRHIWWCRLARVRVNAWQCQALLRRRARRRSNTCRLGRR